MTGLEGPLALVLLLNLLLALVRVARGPTTADRMLAALLFGSTGVGVLLLLAHADATRPLPLASRALVDVALVLALLAAITGVAFALRAWGGRVAGAAVADADAHLPGERPTQLDAEPGPPHDRTD